MKAELLPYKYKALKFIEQYTEKSIVQLGWKARKYIKWSDVHVNNDRDLLKKFGDLAIDDKCLDRSLYARVNEILLNVQYWRLDKEKWSIEPEHEAAWDKARDLIIASNESPQLILSYLSDYFNGLHSIQNTALYASFLNLILTDLIISVKKLPDIKLSESDVSGEFKNILNILSDKQCNVSEFDEYDSELNVLDLFGLPFLEKDESLVKESFELQRSPQFIVIEENLPQSKLYKVDYTKELITIRINANNECIRFINKNNELKCFFIKFIKTYVQTSIENPAMAENMMDFNSYLALNLNREFLNYKS